MWVGEKCYFLTVAQKSSNDRLYNAFRVCEILCTLEACAMGRQISALWFIRKVDSLKVVETLAVGFITSHRFYYAFGFSRIFGTF